jgi:pimeloyl-ACP methyl ester carboxylesterase
MTTIDVHGTAVRYDSTGTGRTVVLLHGGGLDDAWLSWSPISPRVAEHATVIAPDLPGFGGSALGITEPTANGYARWFVAFLDAVGVRRCLVAGLSLGGAVALRAALDVPDRVSGVLGCAPYGLDPRVPGGQLGWLAVHAPGVAALSGSFSSTAVAPSRRHCAR